MKPGEMVLLLPRQVVGPRPIPSPAPSDFPVHHLTAPTPKLENHAQGAAITGLEASLVRVTALFNNGGGPGFLDTAVITHCRLAIPPGPSGRPAVEAGGSQVIETGRRRGRGAGSLRQQHQVKIGRFFTARSLRKGPASHATSAPRPTTRPPGVQGHQPAARPLAGADHRRQGESVSGWLGSLRPILCSYSGPSLPFIAVGAHAPPTMCLSPPPHAPQCTSLATRPPPPQLIKLWYELRLEASAEGVLMSKPTIHPKIILCLDPAAARAPGPGKPAASKPAGGQTASAAPPVPEPPVGVAAPDYPSIAPGQWKPLKYDNATYQIEPAGSFKKVSQAELDTMAAAAAKAAAEAYEAIPSAPPVDDAEGAEAPGGTQWK
jgi:hypothetical protein